MGDDVTMRPSVPEGDPLGLLFRNGGIEKQELLSVGMHGRGATGNLRYE
jgi:hypothetical protein